VPDSVTAAIVGAGPFGLSVAAHLRRVPSRVYGQPMRTWRQLMPPDMRLRSTWEETSFPSPEDRGSTHTWADMTGRPLVEPPPLSDFLAYSDWFRDRFAGNHDPAEVAEIHRANGGFRVTTAAGAETAADAVVIAVGVTPFGRVPEAFAGLRGDPAVSFATEQNEYARFAGHRVVIVGGGQGALEAALWCVRAGAHVDLVVRSAITWFSDREPWRERSPLRQRLHTLAYPVVGYGPPVVNRLAVRPDLFALLPAGPRRRLTRRVLRSGGSPWLRPEVEAGVNIVEGVEVIRAERTDDAIRLELSDGSQRHADHVLLATGYAFDRDRLGFVAPELRAQLELENGWPRLDRTFRSSIPGLYFVGFAAEGRFGPAARFVLGARHAAPTVAAAIAGHPRALAGASRRIRAGAHGHQSSRTMPS
jgi:cation diffusion facilitator CzcD-associated flavoprotein CzcO